MGFEILPTRPIGASGALQGNIPVNILGAGGGVIAAGLTQSRWEAPCSGVITGVSALLDQSGSIVVDVWKDTYGNYPPTDADSITASAPITVSGAIKSLDTTLTGWDKTFNTGDILYFNVDSAGTATSATINIRYTKTGV